MAKFATWNIRGLNDPLKQKEVRSVVISNDLDFVCILETWVRVSNKDRIFNSLLLGWRLFHNYDHALLGRIWICGHPERISIDVVHAMDQAIQCHVTTLKDNCSFWCSAIYASNNYLDRRGLWHHLLWCEPMAGHNPWFVIGDFNTTRFVNEKIGGPFTDHNHYLDNLEGFTWSPQHKESLNRRITQEEIKNAIFSINDSKAPSPDGFTSLFFKKAWSIVGSDVTEAVESFFNSGCMLREINCTIIALVPKVPNPESMHDYRPISCCNTIFKCISKIIASRIKMCLPDIINPSQSAFVHGRSIADNVLITQDLMHNRNNGRPRCALKIDIKKAYDTIGWSCIIDILSKLGTPANILKCIKACITTPSFYVAVNGELAGFFASKRGLRQGDPLSPLLFIIVMEAFSRSLYVVAQAPNFEFHPKCEEIKLTLVNFADDIFLFAGRTTSSVRVIMDELNRFENFSGLQVNKQKSAIFLAGISDAIKNEMLNITGFSLGRLPMKYLGVPLLSTRLSHNDCQPLIDKIMVRIQAWTSRSLSFAGRLQLLSSVLYNIQMYWLMQGWDRDG